MKETVNVSISGIAFILDRECYAMLSNYLSQTEVSLRSNPSSAEILADVEARIAEQILSVQSAEQPVPIRVLRPIIEQLGGSVNTDFPHSEPTATPNPMPLTKRLYRNPEGAILGGVCTGMSTYFNTSVILFRILFLIPLIFRIFPWGWWSNGYYHWPLGLSSLGGTALLIYIILWIVIPRAKTPRQKLEMQGDNITVSSIAQEGSVQRPNKSESGASNAIITILKIFAMVVCSILFLSALGGLLLGFAKISIEMNQHWTPIPEMLDVLGISYFWASMVAAGIVLSPLLTILYLIASAVFNIKYTKIVTLILTILWFLLVIFAFILVMSNIGELAGINWDNWSPNGHYFHFHID